MRQKVFGGSPSGGYPYIPPPVKVAEKAFI